MSAPTVPETQVPSTRPYLIRALHDWCTDHGFTPYIAVFVDDSVQVPMEYVKNQEIVLNIGFEATSGLELGNDVIEFRARFGGIPRDIVVPVDRVLAIYARENGQGMAFPMPVPGAAREPEASLAARDESSRAPRGLRLARSDDDTGDAEVAEGPSPEPPAGGPRPTLKRVK